MRARVARVLRLLPVLSSLACHGPRAEQEPDAAIRASATQAGAPGVFWVHFVDTEGQSAVIDFGDLEIIIDGGGRPNVLRQYLTATRIVDGPIELAVVTDPGVQAFSGIRSLLRPANESGPAFQILELWDTGSPFPSQQYRTFLEESRKRTRVLSPVSRYHRPAFVSDSIQPFALESLPGVKFTLLHADSLPEKPRMQNNSAIVMMVEISGIRMLFPGDAQGTNSLDSLQAAPESVEGRLLALEKKWPGTLRADLLYAPHSGSPTASSFAFVRAVSPHTVVFASDPRFGNPRENVINRYWSVAGRMFSNGIHVDFERDHVACTNAGLEVAEDSALYTALPAVQCNYLSTLGGASPGWRGADPQSGRLFEGDSLLSRVQLRNARDIEMGRASEPDTLATALRGADLRGIDLSEAQLSWVDLSGADLRWSDLRGVEFTNVRLDSANLSYARLDSARLNRTSARNGNFHNVELTSSRFSNVDLAAADLSGARMGGVELHRTNLGGTNLVSARLRSAEIVDSPMDSARLEGADLAHVRFEPRPGSLPAVTEFTLARYLDSLTFVNSPHALVELREGFKKAGLRQQERELTYSIEHTKRVRAGFVERQLAYALFEGPSAYGADPLRPLKLIVVLWFLFTIGYLLFLRYGTESGINIVVARRKRRDPGEFRTKLASIRLSGRRGSHGRTRAFTIRTSWFTGIVAAAQFSLMNVFNLRVQWLEAGTWLRMIQARPIEFEPIGWVRTLAGIQSLVSMYLLALSLLTYFGRPFE